MGSGPDPYPSYFGDKNRNQPHPQKGGLTPEAYRNTPEESRTEKGWEGGRMDPRKKIRLTLG
jgi:hypothetical protein